MMHRLLISFCLASVALGPFTLADDTPSAASAPSVESIVELLNQLKADPASREAAEKALREGLEGLRGQLDEAAKPLDKAAEELESATTKAADLEARIEDLTGQLEAAKQEAAAISVYVPKLQETIETAKKGQGDVAEQIAVYERALELLEAMNAAKPDSSESPAPVPAPPPAPAPAQPAPVAVPAVDLGDPVNFNREIRPILSNNCFACHGPDTGERKASLRLDEGDSAYSPLKSGHTAIVPGNPAQSELVRRITTTDDADRMPPAKFNKTLKPAEIDLLTRWVAQGGKIEPHWAFVTPKRPELPAVRNTTWPRNPIDHFILARLEREGLDPSPEADKHALIRRVSLDLTGLPPTPEEVDAFMADAAPDAYEKVVDRLLQSPHYGEQMARNWLDVARYADTNGFHIDNERYMWRWRDWVIDSFNKNQPFDQFTIEQLAGDLLPNPTVEQKIATGFNRNHMITFEGGIIPEEYRVQYVVDRLNTTSTVWMGLTMGCAQCHDHKFDPISMRDFYQAFAFFNSVPEKGSDGNRGNAEPLMKAPLPHQQKALEAVQADIDGVLAKMRAPVPELDAAQADWEAEAGTKVRARWAILDPEELLSTGGATLKERYDRSVVAEGENPDKDTYEFTAYTELTDITAIRLEALTDDSLPKKGVARSDAANFVLTEFEAEISPVSNPEQSETMAFSTANADYAQDRFPVVNAIDGNPATGWAIDAKTENRTAVFVTSKGYGFPGGSKIRVRLKHESEHPRHTLGRFRISLTNDATMAPAEFGPWYVNGPYVAETGQLAFETAFEPEKGVDLKATYPDSRLKWLPMPDLADGVEHKLVGEVAATYLYRVINAPSARSAVLAVGTNDAVKVWINGVVVHNNDVQRPLKADEDKIRVDLREGHNEILMKVVNYGNAYAFAFRRTEENVGDIPITIEQILIAPQGGRSEAQLAELRDFYRSKNWGEWPALSAQLAEFNRKKADIEAEVPTTMIMAELEEPRETFILARGQYDQPTDKVTAAVPRALTPMPPDAPLNRLGFAKWLVDPSHPLTARVTVNRYWQHYFGTGLVKTSEDFGVQGEWPSHPELLDWLATEFIRTGWDVKAMQRLIVTSATYRQSSRMSPELLERDPENRLLARGPRYRMDAETVRDNALAVAGLLVPKIGGPSVRPYQPKGLWEEVSYGDKTFTAQVFEQDFGENLYRRSMYTFWKRQSPPPTMLIFDAPSREVCTARRARTNTPLQALALLNDPQFVEAARMLAERAMREAGPDSLQRVIYAFKAATAREPQAEECAILVDAFDHEHVHYVQNPDAALELLSVGEAKRDETLNVAELAALTTVASMILNLDETVTKG